MQYNQTTTLTTDIQEDNSLNIMNQNNALYSYQGVDDEHGESEESDISIEDIKTNHNDIKKGKFVDINALFRKTPEAEIQRIDKALTHLSEMMHGYVLDAKEMWDTEIGPFIDTTDCMILDKLTPRNYNLFLDFMMEQKTYRLMQVAQKRLVTRRTYLEVHNN